MSSEPTKSPTLLAIAAWNELEAAIHQMVAAMLRNDAHAVDAARQTAHDVLDHHLDLKSEVITAIRLRVERQNRDV